MLLKLLAGLVRWSVLLCVPGGVLWALSPLGVSLSEYRFATPAVFWKLFPSAPLLLLSGLIGVQLWQSGHAGWPGRASFALALMGIFLIVVGDVGKFWLGVDDTYLTTAPAYRAMRIGFLLFALGSITFSAAALRAWTLPVWGLAPFTVFSVGELVAVTGDLGGTLDVVRHRLGVAWPEPVGRGGRGGVARPTEGPVSQATFVPL